MTANLTTAAPTLKDLYPDDAVRNLTVQDRPLLEWLPKYEDFVGQRMDVPLVFGNPQGRSKTFADAQSNKGNTQQDLFVITRIQDYSLISISNELIEAGKRGDGSFVDQLDLEVRHGIDSLADSIHWGVFKNTGANLAQVGSIDGVNLTLKNPNDVVYFEKGMELEGSVADGTTGAVHSGTATVTKVDRANGILTTDSNWTSQIASLAPDDYLFVEGDFGKGMAGLESWLPVNPPSASDSFFGMNRSQDPSRLAGVRVAATEVSGAEIHEKIVFAMGRLRREGNGARADAIILSEETYSKLVLELVESGRYPNQPQGGDVGFSNPIGFVFPGTRAVVVPDHRCPDNRIYLLKKDTWKLASLNAAPHIVDRDVPLLRESNADAFETRVVFYGNLVCYAPGHNCVIDNS